AGHPDLERGAPDAIPRDHLVSERADGIGRRGGVRIAGFGHVRVMAGRSKRVLSWDVLKFCPSFQTSQRLSASLAFDSSIPHPFRSATANAFASGRLLRATLRTPRIIASRLP